MKCILLNIFLCLGLLGHVLAAKKFPPHFSFGASTAAYQVEGGWNADGKGPSIWDHLLHDVNPDWAYKHANGDVAADTYHHGTKDIQYMSAIGLTHYRFSISWARIMPTGKKNKINEAGIKYYNTLIDGLVKANIQPLVTLYHWDLPNALQDEGGWLNPKIADYYEDYARLAFERFGDRVKMWLTFNEPISTCLGGYEDGSTAPLIKKPGTGAYDCAHNVLRSHAKAYRLYESQFKAKQKGRVSITIDTSWFAANTDSDSDKKAAERNLIFKYEWWMTPIMEGDYPELIKQVVATNSKEEGLPKSRLPVFTEAEKKALKKSADFVALNHYTSYLCWKGKPWGKPTPSWHRDVGVDCRQPDDWEPGKGWLRITPWGMRAILNWIKNRYNNPEVIITENGYSDGGELKDKTRVRFHREYLQNLLDALIDDGCNVIGYTAWSLMDDFEWGAGYLAKFGLVSVDFSKDTRPRTRKYSSYVYEHIIKTREIDPHYDPPYPPSEE